jgi:hypothetical protein
MAHPKTTILKASDKLFYGRPSTPSKSHMDITPYVTNAEKGKRYEMRLEGTNRNSSRITNSITNSGVYNYIVFYNHKTNTMSVKFALVNPMFEKGTKHFHIRDDPNLLVFAAGELQYFKGVILFNILSGTYSLPIIHHAENTNKQKLERYMKETVKEVLSKAVTSASVRATNLQIVGQVIGRYSLKELKNAGLHITQTNA